MGKQCCFPVPREKFGRREPGTLAPSPTAKPMPRWAREQACTLPRAAACCFSPEPDTEAQTLLPPGPSAASPTWLGRSTPDQVPGLQHSARRPGPGLQRFPVDAPRVPCEPLPLVSLLGNFSGWLGGSRPADTSFTTCWLVFLFQGRRGCGCKINLWLFFFLLPQRNHCVVMQGGPKPMTCLWGCLE